MTEERNKNITNGQITAIKEKAASKRDAGRAARMKICFRAGFFYMVKWQ